MDLQWNLSELFESNDAFYKQADQIRKLINAILKYEHITLDENSLLELLDEKWKIKELTNNILVYGSLMYYKNVNSKECIELKTFAENFKNEIDLKLSFIDNKILELGKEKVEDFLIKNPKLKTYQLSLDNLFRMQQHVQTSTINEKLTQNENEINTKIQLYNNTVKAINYGEIEIEDKTIELTSSNFVKYLASRNRDTRKQTYLVVNDAFKKLQEQFADILDSIMGYRIESATLEGYTSVLEKVLFEEVIDPKIIETLIKTVNKNLSLLQRYLKLKTNVLNIKDPHLYDFGVPFDSHINKKYSFEEAIEIIKKALEPLGKKYLEVIDKLLDGHIDAILDENKHQTITFSWHTYSFLIFRGAYNDIKNMIHELGHIVNYYLSKNNVPYIYEDSTVFVGETASIVNEILLNRYLYEQAETNEEKIFYLSKGIENYFTSVFKQTLNTEFENELYQSKLDGSLTPEICSSKYGSLIKKYYGENIIYDEDFDIEWTRIGQIYRWRYYPYKYATGLIMASVVVNSLIDEHTLSKEEYLKFLSLGSSLNSLDLLKMLHIDLTDSNIIKNGFKPMEKDIDKLEEILSSIKESQ